MNLLKKAMEMAPEMEVIVNGDDSLSTYLAMESGNPYVPRYRRAVFQGSEGFR